MTQFFAFSKHSDYDYYCFNFRQYGQHYIVLVEDAHKYVGYLADNCNLMDAGSGSNQIYLTFPVESTFTEEDVHNYFKYCLLT